jgi:hypothetical protein
MVAGQGRGLRLLIRVGWVKAAHQVQGRRNIEFPS